MAEKWSRRWVLQQSTLVTSLSLGGCLAWMTGPAPEEQVAEHSEELERFRDVQTAIDEGYRTTGEYVRTDEGALGTQFINTTVTELNPENPHAILYNLTEGGEYDPLGFKWFVAAADRDSPPTLFGKEFAGPIEGQTSFVPDHYALHVWFFQENPEGMFALYNPAVDPPELVNRISPVREQLSSYYRVSEAEGDGYVNTEKCVDRADGGYGFPFVREDNDGSGGTDPSNPPILIYRLTPDWEYQLMGAEWYVPTSEASEPPTMFGQQFHEPMDGHESSTEQPNHYGLHAWFFKANPEGMFSPFNPTVSC